ncbi:DUF423 domain-containing protein [Luteithermobacter gelatinilyticus]|uniref:DUF423 domain-containing protein n=1 Tax=Luteithermobacter gelatinilyticus TaxID=2582913 RepID=UPI001106E786|nr:DUF423 domain-containing protein [Luteithermobacter gelatinilyticus]
MTFWRFLLIITATSGFLAVLLGAAGSHALTPLMQTEKGPSRFDMASQYHMWHTLALLGCCTMGLGRERLASPTSPPSKTRPFPFDLLKLAALMFLLGIMLFSGNLYLHAFQEPYALSILIPVGGIFLMAGWLMLALSVICLEK